jgi:hypothetical protein
MDLRARVETVLRDDARAGLVEKLAASAATLADVARSLPPPGAEVRDARGRAIDAPDGAEGALARVYVDCGAWFVALPAAVVGRAAPRAGRPEEVLARIDAALGSRLGETVPARLLPRFHDAEQRARALAALFATPEEYFHGALALAVCAEPAHAPAALARVPAWHRTRVALVRAGVGAARAVGPARRAAAPGALEQLRLDVAAASPLASITRAATAAQVLVLCAVACYGGARGLRCVLAGLGAAVHSQAPDAVARALGKASRALARYLPPEVRAMLSPAADVRCAASSLAGLLAAAGLVPPLAAAAAQAAADCPPASAHALPYDAPCRLVAMACDFAAAALGMSGLRLTDPPTLPATGDAAEWLPRGAPPAVGDAAEWAPAVAAYLDETHRLFEARRALARVLEHFPHERHLPDAAHRVLAALTVCAIAAASGMWGPSTSLARGTMLAYLAWHNPALASALRLCAAP